MHAALFARPYVRFLRVPFTGSDTEAALSGMQILPQLVAAAGEGTLSPTVFGGLLRKRRRYVPYLQSLVARAEAAGHPRRAAAVARNVHQRLDVQKFRQKLEELTAQGVRLPPAAQPGKP
jgi:hypothetical protein